MAAVNTKVTKPSTNARMRLRKLRSTVKGMPMTRHVKWIRARLLGDTSRSSTSFALLHRASATCFTFALLAAALPGAAAEISVTVVDRDGHGIEDAVVTATPVATAAPVVTATPAVGKAPSGGAPKDAVMDQRNRSFVPRVLAIPVGARVEFPNNDSVSHQVYSFSPAKRFQLPLYKGETHPPITFDQPGLVVLGCNIHDSMVGYIYVTPAPYFGTTDASGTLMLKDLPKDEYQIVVWSPYIADPPSSLSRAVHVEADTSARIQLTQPLRARPEPKPRRRDWDY
jgi:plastocyanin